MFSCKLQENFKDTFLTEHPRMTASCVYLWILSGFSEHLFIEYLQETVYFMYKWQDFTSICNLTGAFQAFCTRVRRSPSKVFIYSRK